MALDLWGEEMVVEVPKKKPRRKEVQPFRRPAYCSDNNDIDGWFRENSPQTLAECDDVRKALSKKSQVGNYEAGIFQARTGTRLVRVKGPVGNVMIVSAAARKYFNKKLRNLEIRLEVYLEQFGTQQPEIKPRT